MHLSLTDSCLPRSRIVETISYGCISRSNKSAIAASASGFDIFLLQHLAVKLAHYASEIGKTLSRKTCWRDNVHYRVQQA